VISARIRDVWFDTAIGNTTSDTSDAMMKTTGNTVVHVLSGPTLQMLRRSLATDRPPYVSTPERVFGRIRAERAICLPPAADPMRYFPLNDFRRPA
jgi:hypothetical protein